MRTVSRSLAQNDTYVEHERYTESTPTDAAALSAQELHEHREAFESTA
jgi:hypothetical protein